jgi:hypothetical protein
MYNGSPSLSPPTMECQHGRYLNSEDFHRKESGIPLKHTSLALTSPRREVEWTLFDQSAGHVKPFNWSSNLVTLVNQKSTTRSCIDNFCFCLSINKNGRIGGIMFFFFRSEIFFLTTRVRIYIFFVAQSAKYFPVFNIRLYDKNSKSNFFFLHQNQNIFSAILGIRIFFQKKNIAPSPLEVKPCKLNDRSLARYKLMN